MTSASLPAISPAALEPSLVRAAVEAAAVNALAGISSAEAGARTGETAPSSAPIPEPAPQAAQAPPPPPGPESALAEAVSRSAAVQDGFAGLFADLAAASASGALPPAVQSAAARVLAFALPVDPPPDAAAIRTAFQRSGLFFESSLAAGGDGQDLKGAILALAQSLAAWSGPADGAGPRTGARAAPPLRGAPLSAEPPQAPPADLPTAAPALARRLQTEAASASAREVLLQAASAAPARSGAQRADAAFRFDVPLSTGQGPSVAQFEISRDGGNGSRAEAQEPVFRARFTLAVTSEAGPVHADVSVQGQTARVSLWAESGETGSRLSDARGELEAGLAGAGLSPEVRVRAGAPPDRAPIPAGQFMDRSA